MPEEIHSKVVEAITHVKGIAADQIDISKTFREELDMDGLDVYEVCLRLEETTPGISFTNDEAFALCTVLGLEVLLMKKIGG